MAISKAHSGQRCKRKIYSDNYVLLRCVVHCAILVDESIFIFSFVKWPWLWRVADVIFEIKEKLAENQPNYSGQVSNVKDHYHELENLDCIRHHENVLDLVVILILVLSKGWVIFDDILNLLFESPLYKSVDSSDIKKIKSSLDSNHFDNVEKVLPITI